MSARLFTILALVLASAGIAIAAGQVRDHDATWVAPPRAAARVNPLSGRVDLVAGGSKVFHERCEMCHGEDGRGTDEAPDLGQPEVQGQSDGELFWKISAGNAHEGMPAFSFLPEAQRWQLVLHLRGLREP